MAVPGTMGKIASVSLSNGTVQIEQPDDELYLRYLGGYGLGAHYLYTRMEAGADPLGPANLLGFFAGPLTGTPAICGNRFQVVAKSPKTGGFGDANCGGNFGPYLKFAGFDGVLIGGVSEEPDIGSPSIRLMPCPVPLLASASCMANSAPVASFTCRSAPT